MADAFQRAGIDLIASITTKSSVFCGSGTLAEACDKGFAHSVALHDKADALAFGDKFGAAPLSWVRS